MLLSLLLLLPAATAPSLQEPAPAGEPATRWDGASEDAYRRALHLWQVRGRPDEAAALLQSIADDEAVIQLPGQAAWILALAARALQEAGRGEEAAALLPGAERGARGTPFEAFVRREAALLRQSGAGELDEAFLATLLEALNREYEGDQASHAESIRAGAAAAYRRPVLPYLLAVLDRWPSEAVRAATVRPAIDAGLALADAGFVDGLLERTERMTTLSFLAAMPGSARDPEDELARQESLRFLLACARHSDPERVAWAKSNLGWRAFSRGDASAGSAVLELLRDEDPRHDEKLLQGLSGADAKTALEPILGVAELPVLEAAHEARWRLARAGGHLDRILRWAEGGDEEDQARYLLALLHGFGASDDYEGSEGKFGVRSFLQGSRFASYFTRMSGSRGRNTADAGKPHATFHGFAFLKPFLRDGEARTLLALAAAAVRDEAGVTLAYEGGQPSDEAALVRELRAKDFLPRCVADRLPIAARFSYSLDDQYQVAERHAPERITVAWCDLAAPAQLFSFAKRLHQMLMQKGRYGEAATLMLHARLSSQERMNLLFDFVNASEAFVQHLPEVLGALAVLDDGHRSATRSHAESKVRQVEQRHWDSLGVDALTSSMELLLAAGEGNWVAPWLTSAWSGKGREAAERFATDSSRFEWLARSLLDSLGWPTRTPVVRWCLERGAPAGWLQSVGLNKWILDVSMDETGEVAAIAALLLDRQDPVARGLGLECLARRPAAVDSFWERVEPDWRNPSLAAMAARAMRTASDRDRLVQALEVAWATPGVADRASLIGSIADVADPRFAHVLLAALQDPDAGVSGAARAGLQRLKEIEEQRAFWAAWEATGVGGSPTAALIRMIRGENKEQALYAIQALGALRDPASLPLLIELTASRDMKIAAAARSALRWLDQPPGPR